MPLTPAIYRGPTPLWLTSLRGDADNVVGGTYLSDGWTEDMIETPDAKNVAQLKSQMANLEQLIQIEEQTIFEQSQKLERTLHQLDEEGEALRQSERRYRQIVETAQEGVWIIHEEKVLYANDRLADLLGYSKHEIIGQPVESFIPPEFRERAKYKRNTTREGRKEQYDFTFRRKDGSPLPVIVSASPLFERDTTCSGVLEMLTDITERTMMEDRLLDSEELYHSLVEHLPQNIFRKNRQGEFTFVNGHFCEFTGKRSDEVLGKTDFDLYPPELASKYHDDDCKIMESGTLTEKVEEHHLPGGPRTYVRVIKSPLRDSQGNIIGIQGIFWDITEGKRTGDQLRKLSFAVEQSPSSVVITDLHGNIEYVNRKFVEVTGYAPEEVIGRNPRVLKSGATSAGEYQNLWATIVNGAQWHGEFHNKKKNGELYWESATLTPIKDQSGNITHFLALKEDITERKQAQQERDLMEIQLREALKLEAVGRLAAGIAHEINTPAQYVGDNTRFLQDSFSSLISVLNMFKTLLNGCLEGAHPAPELIAHAVRVCEQADLEYLSEEIPKAISQSLEGLSRVSAIVQAMKEFSHPRGDDKQSVDLNHLIDSTLTIARNEWKYVAEVLRDFDPALPPVPCYPGEFNQVILNLVVNAAHAIAEVVRQTRGKGVITVRTRREGSWAVVRIGDTGPGIPEAIRAKIFDPFFTTKEVGKGSGQGLTIARSSIVGKHGGKIDFDTTIGQGTTFNIYLPL
jgi:two-component system, NtrC family, sensor kinase